MKVQNIRRVMWHCNHLARLLLIGFGLSLQAFKQFDGEGDGTADVCTMIEALKVSDTSAIPGELAHVVRTLQACSLTPGLYYNWTHQ